MSAQLKRRKKRILKDEKEIEIETLNELSNILQERADVLEERAKVLQRKLIVSRGDTAQKKNMQLFVKTLTGKTVTFDVTKG